MAARKKFNRLWVRIMLYLFGAWVLWCAVLFFAQRRMLFPADLAGTAMPPPKNAVVLRHEIAPGKTVEAWFFPAPAAEHPAPLVVYFHGNAELIDDQQRIVEAYRAMGCSVLLPEYRGYGHSAGTPSQRGIGEDAQRFVEMALARPDVDAARVAYHGRSLGGGVAADQCTRRLPAALILESTFTSMGRMALSYGAPPFLVRDPFRTARTVRTLKAPLLLFHGSADNIIPVGHGRRLHALAPGARYVEYGAGHNDFPGSENEEAFWAEIKRFLRESGVMREAEPR